MKHGGKQPPEEIRSVPSRERDPKKGPTLWAEHEAIVVRALRGSRDIHLRAPKAKQSQQERQVALGKEQGCSRWGMVDPVRGGVGMQLVRNGVSR
ncbi:hypothetical protein LIER_08352 [Lithospermum erythrorhizon]|uniref:Uncharacterized protein n=1 Tax=Lithospermum erythrorhizon TaxID=34254 RepID=A0AAV3PCU0_LITER